MSLGPVNNLGGAQARWRNISSHFCGHGVSLQSQTRLSRFCAALPKIVNSRLTVSVVTPLYNEAASIALLAERLGKVFSSLPEICFEWVAVDDGSEDDSLPIIRKQIKIADRWKVIVLARNFGQQSAYRAGLEAASGDAVVFMDADMQDPPELIPEVIKEWQMGNQVVVGCRRSRPEKGFRGCCLWAFHEVFFRLTHGVMPKNSGTFGLCDRVAADALRSMPEVNMFLPAQRTWLGFKQSIVWYDRAARKDEPKQSFKKLFSYAWNGITSFSEIPLHLISLVGLLVCIAGFGYAAVLVSLKLLQLLGRLSNLEVPGFTTVAVAVLCLGGIQLLCLGVIGEYLAKIYREVKRRPTYVVAERIDGNSLKE
jgi:glycosyltransferase involved in cell wall biosynthesis